MPDPEQINIPDFVVRQVGALQLQLAAANEQITALANELAALKASKPSSIHDLEESLNA